MKTYRICRVSFLLVPLAFLAISISAWGQLPGGSQTGVNAAMLKLFEDFTSFTSKADLRVQDKQTKEPMSMLVDFSMLDGQVRMDLDMTTIRSKQLPPQTLASLKAAGLEKVVTVLRPQKKSAIIAYPSARGYVEMPLSPEESADMARTYKIEKTKLGRETVGGQACDKTKVVLTADNGEKQEATVWYAPGLKNFPVQMQMDQRQMTVLMQYRDVRFARPDPKQFEAPTGFTKHASNEQLMQSAMMKALGGAGAK